MNIKKSLIATAVLLSLLAASPFAYADLSDEIQVYTDDINEPGKYGLELHVNTTPSGRNTPDYPGEVVPRHGIRITPEFSYGLSKTWEAGLYIPGSIAANGHFQIAGAKLRMKWLPVQDENGGWFYGENVELSRQAKIFSESRTSLELRTMIGYRNSDWLISFNPVLGWNLSDGFKKNEADISAGLKVSRQINEKTALGFEYYTDLGTTSDLLPNKEQAKEIYLTVDSEVFPIGFNFGIGHGIGGGADKWTVKAIFEFPF